MRLLEALVATPLAGVVGWTLLHSLWQGAIISAALGASLMMMRSPRTRYAAACLAMLLMLGGFAVTLVRLVPGGIHSLRTVRTAAFPTWNFQEATDVTSPSNTGLAAAVPWLAPFWIAGVCSFYLGHVASWISVCRLRRRSVCCASDKWQKQLTYLSAHLRLSRPIQLLESCLADTPMVLGHFRPIILMPIGLLAGLTSEHIEAILLHELAHIRRFDYLVNLLQRSVEGLLFYNPALWWISRVIRAERENCCDDVAVAISGNAHEYAAALAVLEQNRWSGREPAVAATGGNLVKRIRRLLYPEGPNGGWTPLFGTVILMATAAVTLLGLQSTSPQRSSAAVQSQSDATETSPYFKWLNEDVVYIISDQERVAFKKLTTDEDRKKFIEQFWQQRDPTPGTPENEFQEEHYRRIAFANEHYASGIPGWKTDRGRIYITLGPPDEIDAHPSGGQGTPVPFEDWIYRHIEGVGDDVTFNFTDPQLNGEYRLTLNPLPANTAVAPATLAPRIVSDGRMKPGPDRMRVGASVQQRNLITQVDPIYPPLAMQARIHGVVRFTIVIGKDGRVSNTELVNGHPLLVAAASDAVRQWVYKPTLLNGEPVEVVTQVDVNFTLAAVR